MSKVLLLPLRWPRLSSRFPLLIFYHHRGRKILVRNTTTVYLSLTTIEDLTRGGINALEKFAHTHTDRQNKRKRIRDTWCLCVHNEDTHTHSNKQQEEGGTQGEEMEKRTFAHQVNEFWRSSAHSSSISSSFLAAVQFFRARLVGGRHSLSLSLMYRERQLFCGPH